MLLFPGSLVIIIIMIMIMIMIMITIMIMIVLMLMIMIMIMIMIIIIYNTFIAPMLDFRALYSYVNSRKKYIERTKTTN